MIKLQYRGRLGNNLIQYAAGHILAKRTGMTLDTAPETVYANTGNYKTSSSDEIRITTNFGDVFNIEPVTGYSNSDTIELNDKNYYNYLNNPNLEIGYELAGYFQDSRLLCDHRTEILDLYQYNKSPEINISPDDAFFACRFGDCLVTNRTYCTIEYIENQLKTNRSNFQRVYMTSDSLDHPPLVELINEYNITPYNNHPLHKILFASNFNNLILSAGSFSYWMAYLSEATNIVVYNCKQDPLQKQNAWDYNQNIKFSN